MKKDLDICDFNTLKGILDLIKSLPIFYSPYSLKVAYFSACCLPRSEFEYLKLSGYYCSLNIFEACLQVICDPEQPEISKHSRQEEK